MTSAGALRGALDAAVEGLVGDWVGSLIISTGIVVLFVVAETWKRLAKVPTEWTRKLTHLGAGAIVMSFPWLIDSAISALALALSFGLILVAGKKTGLLSSVHDVERKTQGAYLYPLAVFGVFMLADGDALLFCVPLAIMAVADTGAAIVGKHAGGTRYKVLDGERSLEGSLSFFGIAFAIAIGGLALAGRPGWPASLLVALVVAILTTSVEAVSVRGSDNVLIPYAAWIALERTLDLGLAGLEPWLVGMLCVGTVLAVTWRQAQLTVAGGVTLFLIGSLAYATGGWAWAAPFYAVYALFLVVRLPRAETDLDEVFATSAGSLVLLLAFSHTGQESLLVPFLVTVSANAAILMGTLVWQWSAERGGGRIWSVLRIVGVVIGALVPAVVSWALGLEGHLITITAGGIVGVVLFRLVEGAAFKGRRLLCSLSVGVLAWAVLG
ncbi:MAG TPA: hypothetical protein QGF58_28530 [Myxococcota bacterium]|nr:hypothetical protein [Myxococcota bacterium]